MWFIIIGAFLAAVAAGLLYISWRAAKLPLVLRVTGGRKWPARLFCLAAFLALTAVLWLVWDMMNALVCLLHLVVCWMICDFAAWLAARLRRQKSPGYRAGYIAPLLCVLYLAAGWFAAHHVWTTAYTLHTEKLAGNLRIVQITDAHLGTTFDAEGFSRYIGEINALSPDAVVITGDFVDDGTSEADMLGACRALGDLRARCGVYFVYGNHDKGYARRNGWTNASMRDALAENGVVVLEDETRLIDGRFYIVGRRDRSDDRRGQTRKTAEALLAGLDRSKYILMLDHQPYDFDAEAAAGADLVLCGHTHGGQFIPIRHVGEWIGENCLRYGHEERLDTDFIVSSGISDWAFHFKTGCHSEYVVVDITGSAPR